jgi:hypothetical protein
MRPFISQRRKAPVEVTLLVRRAHGELLVAVLASLLPSCARRDATTRSPQAEVVERRSAPTAPAPVRARSRRDKMLDENRELHSLRGPLSVLVERCGRSAVGVRTMCSIDLEEGSADFEECVKACTAARVADEARRAQRAAAGRVDPPPQVFEEHWSGGVRDGPPSPSQEARDESLKQCVAGVVESSRLSTCQLHDATPTQQAHCDKLCAERASAEIRRIVGPPH